MDEESYKLQLKWTRGRDAKIKQLKEQAEKPPSFKPHMYTSKRPKMADGHVADLTLQAGSNYASRQQRAREAKQQQKERFDNLGNVKQGRQRSVNVSLPVEAAAEAVSPAPARGPEEAWAEPQRSSPALAASGTYVMEDLDASEEETLVEMLQRERREWHSERTKLIHCVHIQQMELMQRAAASHERAADIAKEFARTIEGFEERLYNVEANVQKEIIAIKMLAENIRASTSGSSSSVENRMSRLESGIDTIIERLGAAQGGQK